MIMIWLKWMLFQCHRGYVGKASLKDMAKLITWIMRSWWYYHNKQMHKDNHDMGYVVSFLPEASFGLRVLSLPACVRVSVNHELVCAITRHKFELESPNHQIWTKKCKIFCSRPLLFWGLIGLDLPGQISLYWKIMFICIAFASLKYLWDMSV